MRWRWSSVAAAGAAAVACLLIAVPVSAHPGSVWGIDLASALSIHDQARVFAHHHQGERADESEDETAESNDGTAAPPTLREVQTVVIDPGHGGDNSGATGVAGIPEKQLTLQLAYALREQLQQRHPSLRVILTRYWDESVGLSDRVEMANAAGADLLLSLHYNAAPHDRAVGFETYFLEPEQVTPGQQQIQGQPVATTDGGVTGLEPSARHGADEFDDANTLELIRRDLIRAHRHHLSGTLAETVQAQFIERLDSIDRGVKQGKFTVLQGTEMPAVVVEAGFLTHPEEGMKVLEREHRRRVVDSLVGAVEQFDHHLADAIETDDDDPLEQELDRIASGR